MSDGENTMSDGENTMGNTSDMQTSDGKGFVENKPPVAGRKVNRGKLAGLGALLVIVALLPLLISGSYYMHVLILAFIYVVVASSFRTITISGQFSIAHAAFMGIGGYTAALCSVWLGWPPWVTIPLGAAASTVVGAALAYPFARLRAIYYAMGTLFLGYVITNLFTAGGKITGSTAGLAGVQPLFTGSRTPYYYLFLGLMVLCLLAMYRFEFSRIGVTLKAIAQSPLVASSVGISERRYRILAVGFGCFFCGLIGAAYVHYQMVASIGSFGLSATLWIIMYVLVGGINSFWGPTIGVVVLLVLPEFVRDLKGYLPFVSAAILLLVAFTLRKRGLAGLPQVLREHFLGRRSTKEVNSGAASD